MSLADKMLSEYSEDLTINLYGIEFPLYKAMENLLFIIDKNAKSVPFILNEAQIELYKDMCLFKRNGKPIRENILKARQLGISTFIAGVFTLITLFTPNIRCGICADTIEHASGLFEKYQYFYDHLDDNNPNPEVSYKPKLKYNKGQKMLQTEKGNSIIEIFAVGEGAGRSKNYHLLHCSEVAFWSDAKKTLTALLQCVSDKNLDSMIFLETTGNGFNEYKKRWDNDVANKSRGGSYHPTFIAWYLDSTYQNNDSLPLPPLEKWEEDVMSSIPSKFDKKAKMKWYHEQYLKLQEKEITLQEYPTTPLEAFVSTGDSFFNMDLVLKRKEEVMKLNPEVGVMEYKASYSSDGQDIVIKDYHFVPSGNGPLKIYERPKQGHPYVITCDPSEGGRDYSAIQIFDNHTVKQVASFVSRDLDLDVIAFYLYSLGMWYNEALISSENNRGLMVLTTLAKTDYPNMYEDQKQVYEGYEENYRRKYGHNVNVANRDYMLQYFQTAFKQDSKLICDYETLCQMESFQMVEHIDRKSGSVKRRKAEAAGGKHDDLIMAAAAFFLVRDQQDKLTSNDFENIKREFESNFDDYGGYGIEWR